MVANAVTPGRSGVHDFILLRISAAVLAVFVLFLFGYFLFTPHVSYEAWRGLFSAVPMKVFTGLALVAVLYHGWIGIWQVLTDYIKCVKLRGVLLAAVVLLLLTTLLTGVFVLLEV